MTMPCERTRAVLETRQFLQELANPNMSLDVPESVRQATVALLQHYPNSVDMRIASAAIPEWFGIPET